LPKNGLKTQEQQQHDSTAILQLTSATLDEGSFAKYAKALQILCITFLASQSITKVFFKPLFNKKVMRWLTWLERCSD
jgi:hypothetical protein